MALHLELNLAISVLPVILSCNVTSRLPPSALDLDSLVGLQYYQIFSSSKFEYGFLGLLDKSQDKQSGLIFSQLQRFLLSSSKVISASSAFDAGKIYFIIPFKNSLQLGLYQFDLLEVIGDSIEDLARYISDINKGKKLLLEVFSNCQKEVETIANENSSLYKKCEILARGCKKTLESIRKAKKTVCQKYKEFNIQEKDFKKFECLQCQSNQKDVLFLPCGHVVICTKCLKEDFKILVDFPLADDRLKCMVCKEQVEQTIKYNIHEFQQN